MISAFRLSFWVVVVLSLATAALAQRSTPVQLTHNAPFASDFFGNAMAMSGDTLVVAARADDVGASVNRGSAHVFRWDGAAWTLEAILTPSAAFTGTNFSASVAISGDTVAIGADGDAVGANSAQGAVYVFVREALGAWTQQARLTAGDGSGSDRLGVSVAIEGNTIVAGAFGDTVNDLTGQGSAYVFTRLGSVWTQRARLLAPDGTFNDNFGTSVALAGDDAIVGAPNDDVGANVDQGSIHIFRRQPSGAWTHQQQLVAADGAAGDRFAYCLAASDARGGTLAAGAYQDDVGAVVNQGSAYVFARDLGGVWAQQAQLVAADGAVNDSFGFSVATHGDTVIVGAYLDDFGGISNRGSASVFRRIVSVNGAAWAQESLLLAPDAATSDAMGASVAVWGDRAATGSPQDTVNALGFAGSAWVFTRAGSAWIDNDVLVPTTMPGAGDLFGSSVDVEGNTLVVGAPWETIGANERQGSVYVFVRSGPGAQWIQQAKLTAPTGAAFDQFGISVAISGNTIVIGSNEANVLGNPRRGSAHVFVRSGTMWSYQAELTDPNGAAEDFFGSSISVDGNIIAIAVPGYDFGAYDSIGAVCVFTRSGTTWAFRNRVVPYDGQAGDNFGSPVRVSGDVVAAGSRNHDIAGNNQQGAAYLLTPNADYSLWSIETKLIASDGVAADYFGSSIAMDGATLVVGAPYKSVNGMNVRGAMYVFARVDGAWTEQAKLAASDGQGGDLFSASVAIAGGTVAAGAPYKFVGGVPNVGSIYVFHRIGTTWAQVQTAVAYGGQFDQQFGFRCSFDGATLAGTSVGGGISGFVATVDLDTNALLLAHNDTLALSYNTIDTAFAAASSGHTITATTGAFDAISALDTAGRTLYVRGTDRIRTPLGSTLTLGGGSALFAAAGRPIEIHGQIRAAASSSVDLHASEFILGGTGLLTVRAEAAMAVNAMRSRVEGRIRLERDSSITFTGDADSLGGLTATTGCAISCDGELRSSGLWSLVGGQVYTPHFVNCDTFQASGGVSLFGALTNRGSARVIGESGIFGNLANDGGATLTIRAGTLFVFGSLANNGSIVGEVCTTCFVEQPPRLEVGGSLSLGAAASLLMPSTGAVVRTGGDFDCAIDSNARYDMALATLEVIGLPGERTLEAMSRDVGANETGLDRNLPGHYPVGMLRLGGGSIVTLVDAHDNDGLGQSACEAIYVDELRIDSGARLINPSCRIYYNTLVNNGTIDVPANVIQIAPPCRADFDQNGVVAVPDIFAFLSAWFAGSPAADFDGNAFISVPDIFAFLSAWFAGCS